jgi:hypothetical protein
VPLTEDDERYLARLEDERREIEVGTQIRQDGFSIRHLNLVKEGWLFGYTILA